MITLLFRLLNKNQRYRKVIPVGEVVDVIYCGGCMDTEIYRVKGVVANRSKNLGVHQLNENSYRYVIETEKEVLHIDGLWSWFNPDSKTWEFQK